MRNLSVVSFALGNNGGGGGFGGRSRDSCLHLLPAASLLLDVPGVDLKRQWEICGTAGYPGRVGALLACFILENRQNARNHGWTDLEQMSGRRVDGVNMRTKRILV